MRVPQALLLTATATALLALSGCPKDPSFIQCRDNTSCDRFSGGQCLVNEATGHQFCAYPDSTCQPTGLRWSDEDVEASISGMCMAGESVDAGVDSMPDASTIDSTPPDANPQPCGLRVAFQQGADGSREVWVSNPDGTGAVNISNNTADDINPSWSPSGTQIAFQTNRNGNWDIVVVGADGSNLVNLTGGVTLNDERPSWSPDGTKIAFVRSNSLYVMSPSGAGLFQVTSMQLSSTSTPFWSPDSHQIGFLAGEIPDLYIVDATMGAVPVDLTNTASAETGGAWAPATRIVYPSFQGGSDIFTMDSDGQNQTNVTNDAASDYFPHWTPDGNTIAYSSTKGGNVEVWSISATGTNPAQLTTNTLSASGTGDYVQDVSPDGQWVLFDRRASSTASQVGVVGITGNGVDVFTIQGGANARNARWSSCL